MSCSHFTLTFGQLQRYLPFPLQQVKCSCDYLQPPVLAVCSRQVLQGKAAGYLGRSGLQHCLTAGQPSTAAQHTSLQHGQGKRNRTEGGKTTRQPREVRRRLEDRVQPRSELLLAMYDVRLNAKFTDCWRVESKKV